VGDGNGHEPGLADPGTVGSLLVGLASLAGRAIGPGVRLTEGSVRAGREMLGLVGPGRRERAIVPARIVFPATSAGRRKD
jgi:hypothetical protein